MCFILFLSEKLLVLEFPLLMFLDRQILKIRCLPCFGEAGAPGVSKTDKENVSRPDTPYRLMVS